MVFRNVPLECPACGKFVGVSDGRFWLHLRDRDAHSLEKCPNSLMEVNENVQAQANESEQK